MEFWKHVPPPRVDDDNDGCVPNVKGHSCFLFSALTILFASWLTSRFVPTRNIKLCQGKTTVSRECFQLLFSSLPSSSIFFRFFLFRFFLVQNRVHDFLVTLGNRDYAKREKREKIELDKLSFGFMLYVFPWFMMTFAKGRGWGD